MINDSLELELLNNTVALFSKSVVCEIIESVYIMLYCDLGELTQP